jgi:transposase
MLTLTNPSARVYLCTRALDMRKSFDGLVAATKTLIGENPLSGHWFVFVNRKADYVKCLYWSRGGYCVWAKRLQRGCFARVDCGTNAVTLTDTQFLMWLDGIDWRQTAQKKRFVLPTAAQSFATISQ